MAEWQDGWDRAENATQALREALEGMGAPEDVRRRLRPLVSDRGTPWVDVGQVPAHVAERLAEVLRSVEELSTHGR